MNISGKCIVVTGAARGIGRALCLRFAREKPACIVVADRDYDGALQVASQVGGIAYQCDVSDGDQIQRLVDWTEQQCPIDLFCSNAGFASASPRFSNVTEYDPDVWSKSWHINVMAHVRAAAAVLPKMIERRSGYLCQTISAAGLLNHPTDAAYAVTKHAAVGFAEHVAIRHSGDGIRVSVVLPQAVATDMLAQSGQQNFGRVIDVREVAEHVLAGIGNDQFAIFPHTEVARHFARKGDDYGNWVEKMSMRSAS
jgi:NAD(P)-dependent dehydrogenase (short-subunit alcohol dehydrogenase family)